MYSVKPGRGPSKMAGIVLLVFFVPFGLVFAFAPLVLTGAFSQFAAQFGGPDRVAAGGFNGVLAVMAFVPMVFGLGFTVVAGMMAYYHLTNASAKDRMSAFDVTVDGEEGDMAAQAMGIEGAAAAPDRFCSHCGAGLESGFAFCPKCGKAV